MPSANGKLACVSTSPQFFGPDALKSADQLRQDRANRSDWPYDWLFPPENATPVNQITQTPVAVPAAPGGPVEVLLYRVPSGQRFIMTGVIQNIFGAAFLPGDGTWTIDRNTPIGINNAQMMPEQGLISIPVQLGSFTSGVIWEFRRPYEFEPLDEIRSKFTNIQSNATLLVSAFLGYLLPDVSRMR